MHFPLRQNAGTPPFSPSEMKKILPLRYAQGQDDSEGLRAGSKGGCYLACLATGPGAGALLLDPGDGEARPSRHNVLDIVERDRTGRFEVVFRP